MLDGRAEVGRIGVRERPIKAVEYVTREEGWSAVAGTSFGGCFLERRIEVILNESMKHRISRPALALILVMSTVVLPVGMSRAFSDDEPARIANQTGEVRESKEVSKPVQESEHGRAQEGSLRSERENQSASEPTLERVLLQGMWESRERLRSGIVNITYVAKHGRSGDSRKEEYHVCFDFDGNRLRFDRREGKRLTQYARTPQESLIYIQGSNVLGRYFPNWNIVVADAKPFDVRSIGFQTLAEYEYRHSFEELRKRLEVCHPSEVVPDRDKTFRLSWEWTAAIYGETSILA